MERHSESEPFKQWITWLCLGYVRRFDMQGRIEASVDPVGRRSRASTSPLLVFAIVAALLLLTFVAYLGALEAGFLFWDDDVYVTKNEFIRGLGPINLLWMFTTTHAANWHPITWLSHALVYSVSGLDPRAHHLANVVIHCLNTVWVFALACVLTALARLPQCDRRGPIQIDQQLVVAAGIAALLFGVHPQHVESVVWIAERKDVLFLFFLLPALLAYVFYTRAESPRRRRALYLTTFACFTLSILSKPMAVTAPIVMLLLDVYPLKRIALGAAGGAGWPSWLALRRLIEEKLPFLLVALFSGLFTIAAQDRALISMLHLGPGLRILNAINSIVLYAWKWAVPLQLSPYYTYPPGHVSLLGSLAAYAHVIVLVALATAACIHLWRRGNRVWLTIWLFYLVTLAPVLGIVTVGLQSSADRYAYLPTIPLYILTGLGASNLLYGQRMSRISRWLLGLPLVAVVAALMLLTYQQTRVWRNDVTFWEHIAREAAAPKTWIVQAGLGRAYQGRADHERAILHIRAALEATPGSAALQHDVALSLLRLGRLDEAVAALPASNSDLPEATLVVILIEIGADYCMRGRPDDARRLARRALDLVPSNADAQRLLSAVREGQCR